MLLEEIMRIRKYKDAIGEEELELIASVSDALAHPVRLQLFRHIMHCNRNRETVCTGDLVEAFDYAQATISQHMKKLVSSGLIQVKKENRFSYYYANLGALTKYIDAARRFSIL